MRPRILPIGLLALACTALVATTSHAWSYGDTLTTIWRPLPNLPALVRPGDSFAVWANAPSGAGGWAASLKFGALVVPLVPAGGGWQAAKGRWEMTWQVPPGTPEEVYDFLLTSNATVPDTSRHAVKVLPAYRTDYYFAQISDTHLPTHAFSSGGSINTADTSGMADFDTVIDDLNMLHPEFILHTGDLVNEGELEEYLGMFEMGRAKDMLSRLHDPVFVSSGNHDQGGWKPTLPPDGTAKRNWWRHYGWPYLDSPPAGDPVHSQDFSFDYGPLHVIGLETYINNGNYDSFRTATYGAQSFTPEQLAWLSADIAAAPAGSKKLAFYHYDFGGTTGTGGPGANFSQINPAALGLDGAIWGHNHVVAEDHNTLRSAKPFNLGLQSVIDYRAFRIFRVSNGVITPGPMHHAGTSVDSLSLAWSAPNNGTMSRLTGTVTNRFGETWEHARLAFALVDHESTFVATGGTIAQVVRQGGMANVDVDCVLPAGGVAVVTVAPGVPIAAGVEETGPAAFSIRGVSPNPFVAAGALTVRWSQPAREPASVAVLAVDGRIVATLFDGVAGPGEQAASWYGRTADGGLAPPGLYLVRVLTRHGQRAQRFVLVR